MSLFIRFLIIEKHDHCHGNDDAIPQNTQPVRNLRKQQESQSGGKNDLGVVVNRDFLCRSVAVRRGHAELSAGCGNACHNQTQKLFPRHRLKGKQQIRQRHHAGKRREEKDDERLILPDLSQTAHHGVCQSGTESAQQPDQRRGQMRIGKAGLDDAERPDKCAQDDQSLFPVQLFPEEEP